EPPTSSEDCFVSSGRLHSVTLKNLEPGVEYAYRPGLEFGQGVNGGEKYRVFRGCPGLSSKDEADDDAKVQAQGGAGVAKLISTLLDQQRIDSIHHIGGLSLAHGDAKGRRYSYDQTLVHFVVLSSEHDLALGSEQNE
ncbi:hypothetical protein ACHAWF_000582, partial [Thalassiosira exigua]